MQSDVDIIRSFYAAIDQGDLNRAGQYLADDFESPRPAARLGKPEWLEVIQVLQDAMPNLKHSLSNISQEGPVVKVTVQAGGRHTRPLDLAKLQVGIETGVVAGSGRMIIFEPDRFEYTLAHGKIKAERNVTRVTERNGLTGFLSALGVTM